jgi:hypothetical protein
MKQAELYRLKSLGLDAGERPAYRRPSAKPGLIDSCGWKSPINRPAKPGNQSACQPTDRAGLNRGGGGDPPRSQQRGNQRYRENFTGVNHLTESSHANIHARWLGVKARTDL